MAIWRDLIKRLVFSIISGFDRTNYFEGLAMAPWLPNKRVDIMYAFLFLNLKTFTWLMYFNYMHDMFRLRRLAELNGMLRNAFGTFGGHNKL